METVCKRAACARIFSDVLERRAVRTQLYFIMLGHVAVAAGRRMSRYVAAYRDKARRAAINCYVSSGSRRLWLVRAGVFASLGGSGGALEAGTCRAYCSRLRSRTIACSSARM